MATSTTIPQSITYVRHIYKPAVWLLYHASRLAQRRSTFHQSSGLKRTTSKENYRSWRAEELRNQITQHFDPSRIEGFNVLDFGCGTGELCSLMATHNPMRIVGVDISEEAVQRARASQSAAAQPTHTSVEFIHAERKQAIPVDDATIDLISCFDVVEHIADVSFTLREWQRMLRPGGKVWIWWSSWRGPFGHHMESLIPLPWVHLIFPQRSMFEACAELYDAPDFVPRVWDRDAVTGQKKPNKWRSQQSFYPFLNKLTQKGFERQIREVGLTINRCEIHGFSGSWLSRATRMLIPIPILGDCFVSYYVYELSKHI